MKQYFIQLTQDIMEKRHTAYDSDDLAEWAKWVNGATFGEICVNYDKEWFTSDEQEELISETIQDAQVWFDKQPLIKRMRRLRMKHRLYRHVQRYARRRAAWPTTQLGQPPKNEQEDEMVRNMCYLSHRANPKHSPMLAIDEYEEWWKTTRIRRTGTDMQEGDKVQSNARDYFNALNGIQTSHRLCKILIKNQKDLIAKVWPEGESPWQPCNTVEWDIFNDWFFLAERKIKAYMPQEFSRNKWKY